MLLDFCAGCLGGFSGIIVGHPFDTVKVRLQGQDFQQKKYSNTWHCFKEIITKESIFGLYKGIRSPLYGQVLINAVVFGVHGNVFRQFADQDIKAQFIAGSIAGGIQSIICSPMELIKIRLQMQNEAVSTALKHAPASFYKFIYVGPKDCMKKIYMHENGIKGVFRGMYLTLWREIPSFGFYFASYYYLCEKCEAIKDGEIDMFRLLFCGGSAGVISWISTYPFDVIKTRIQADGMGRTLYSGSIDCALKSFKQEGIFVFFRGMNVTLLRAFPGNAATLATVTTFLHLM